MIVKIPPQVDCILQILTQNGFSAFAVGGCVRDSLLGFEPKDWDVTTSAKPEETARVFSDFKVIETGLKHGTVTVLSSGMPVEVTTFRIDGTYSDNRHPDGVTFTENLREDLSRRDFTVNALACGRDGEVIDRFGGKYDLENRVIRCVGEPDRRFQEDGLRILRALRFASVLGFTIEPKTAESLLKNRSLLDNIARERIGAEFLKLLCGKAVSPILLQYREAIEQFIPEIEKSFEFEQHNPHHIYDVWEHTVESVAQIDPEPVLRLTMFLHDLGKPYCYSEGPNGTGHFYGHAEQSVKLAEAILPRLRCDRKTSETVLLLIRSHDLPVAADEKILRRRLNKLGETNLRLLLKVKVADTLAKSPEYRDRVDVLAEIEAMLDRILEQNACFTLKDLKIGGGDLIGLGVPAGPEVGRILDFLLDAVIDGTCENTREALLTLAQNRKGEKP